ncbi:major facilitator family transporter [Klebsiella pneumoniae]|nr:major facilitator family transporter [Klebsiella pneumoniae]
MSAINEKAVNGTQLQRTHKKIYRHLMPLLIVAYIISFIDRTNIGMAKATMSVDIGLSRGRVVFSHLRSAGDPQ